MMGLGDTATENLQESALRLLRELRALRDEGERLRQELQTWLPAAPDATLQDLEPCFDDDRRVPGSALELADAFTSVLAEDALPFDERPTWVPDGEDDRPTIRCPAHYV